MSKEVLVEVIDDIIIITINRPQVRNAINYAVSYQVCAAIDELESNNHLRVGILTGAGSTFCAGIDLKSLLKDEPNQVEGRGILGITLASPLKPLIAAVEGYALAGGFEAILACDLIVAARNAQFGLPEVKRGLVAAAGGLIRLPRSISPRIAMEMALTGNTVSAERLFQYGIINLMVEPGTALNEARELAKRISLNAPLAVAASKRVINEQIDWSLAEMFERQKEIAEPVLQSKDAVEGATAFVEKRAPNWRCR